jgi:hypothetical protein
LQDAKKAYKAGHLFGSFNESWADKYDAARPSWTGNDERYIKLWVYMIVTNPAETVKKVVQEPG